MLLFSCGEADHSSRDKWVLSSFFLLSSHEVQKKVQTVQTNMVVYKESRLYRRKAREGIFLIATFLPEIGGKNNTSIS